MQRGRQFERLFGLIEPDRLPDIINDDLARIAVLEMLLKGIANAGIKLAIHILVQRGEKFFAFHRSIGNRGRSVPG